MPAPVTTNADAIAEIRSEAQDQQQLTAEVAARPQHVRVQIRSLLRDDIPDVVAIEAGSFEFPWSEEVIIRCLCQQNCLGLVAENCLGQVVGFMVYEMYRSRLHVLNLAVHPAVRHCDVGSQLIDRLKSKLSPERRNRIVLEIRERNLPGQQFFRAMGFRAVTIVRDYFEHTSEDAYRMRYRYADDPVA